MEIQKFLYHTYNVANLTNCNTVWWEPRKITTQPGEIDARKSEVIVFFLNAGV